MRRRKQVIISALFILMAVYALYLSIYRPSHNWDIIGYIGVARSLELRDIDRLHRLVYSDLERSVSPATFTALTQGNEYRKTIYSDASAFSEQLPFYQIRPAYTSCIFLLYMSGMNIVFAAHLISGLALAAAFWVMHRMFSKHLRTPFVVAMIPITVHLGILDLARHATPDALAFLMVLSSFSLYLEGRTRTTAWVLPLLICVRTDLVFYVLPLAALIFMQHGPHRKAALISAVVSILVMFAIMVFWEYPGWSTIVYFTLVEKLTYPITAAPELTAGDYVDALVRGIRFLSRDHSFILFALTAAYGLCTSRRSSQSRALNDSASERLTALTWVSVVYVVSHFLAFPAAWSRFYFAPYLLVILAFVAYLSRCVEHDGTEASRGSLSGPAVAAVNDEQRRSNP